ncbi:uncharacterized protein LOC115450536 [Manduca sexta]|uniref:uncharacterized protein LOC115450536 n=1 Tax=Manduca sexta TaxID=7130 RepID=UPI00188E273B|nr:uncharacterized protein LOC115450536 [Manduca sexta]
MNGDVEGVASRPRPLSGGLWTLFNWLRRDDHASSNESLSSVGSDRTAASFAFLAPGNYNVNNTPVFLPPPSPPTDTYRKRVQERIVRRQHERDLTLHRKYGLYRSEGINSYDAFSLPPARRAESDISNKRERERRATSECFQRRAVHVPGKRRAPLPPGRASVGSSATHYRGPRKRPAPQPPIKLIEEIKDRDHISNNFSIHMNSQALREDGSLQNTNKMSTDASEKTVKKGSTSKESKTRLEKGFLKHIFENRKRNSAVDTSAVKILPSISELDKQAASIIENGKLEALKQISKPDEHPQQSNLENGDKKPKADNWFCIKCLRKYDSSVSDCPYCIFESKQVSINTNDPAASACNNYTQTENGITGPSSRSKNKSEDKQKLKEMLKEMKDSLPKRPKHENKHVPNENKVTSVHTVSKTDIVSETPTLRIGAHVSNEDKASISTKPSTSGLRNNIVYSKNSTPLQSFKSVITTTPLVIQHEAKQNYFGIPNDRNIKSKESTQNSSAHREVVENILSKPPLAVNIQKRESELVGSSGQNKNLQSPLRISLLLNPVYVPKNTESKSTPSENPLHTETKSPINKLTQPENKTINQIPVKSENIAVKKPEITNTSIISHTKNMNGKMNDVTNNKEGSNMGNITSEKVTSPVLSNATSKIEDKNATKNINDIKNKSDAHPSTSRDILENESKIKAIDTDGINQHIKRRELINQLEKSIANGDEHAAAEAAIKLAQLRLSCSVLSFSSRIMSEPSTSSSTAPKGNPIGLITVATKNISHKTEINNVIVPTESGVLSKKTTEITPIASSAQKSQSATTIKDSSENDKAVPSSSKNESEKREPLFNKVSQNVSQFEVLPPQDKGNTDVSISVWIEDKEATRGPIKLKIQRQAVVGDLRRQAEAALGLPSHLQRWIVGRTLCTDDNTALLSLAGSEFNAPFYLCLVETDPHAVGISRINTKTPNVANADNNTGNNVYKELVQLEQQALVPNAEVFECGVCIEECKAGSGVVLRECVHMFCKDCLADVVKHSEEPDISCPAMGCSGVLQEREIRGLVSPEEYEKWLARGLAAAESGTRNAFHCRTRDCTGWALCDPGVRRFLCPVCKHSNCVPCQAIHEGETCDKYRSKLQAVSNPNSNKSDDSTRALLTNLINKGEALECPECKAIITKMWGCDWVKCSACKTEICWVTRGRRWGPAGRGDTSAGCRCGVDGKRCHPSCGYCH